MCEFFSVGICVVNYSLLKTDEFSMNPLDFLMNEELIVFLEKFHRSSVTLTELFELKLIT